MLASVRNPGGVLDGLRVQPPPPGPPRQLRRPGPSSGRARPWTPAPGAFDSERAEQSAPEAEAVPTEGWLWARKAPPSRQSLRQQNIRPKKSLGQNFMVDDSVLEAITAAAGLAPGDPVLEVGPGTGALTVRLLETGALVTAVEKDYGLHDRLAAEFAGAAALELVCGDVLRQDLSALLDGLEARHAATAAAASGSNAPSKVKVVANLPYYITKDFLTQALPAGDRVSSLLLMVQDEVAVRLTQEQPGGPDWRAMNIIVRYYCEPSYLFKIDRKKYVPSPKVHGAVVDFALRPAAERATVPDERQFLSLVKRAFLQRRKVLRNALQPLVSSEEAAEAMAAAGLAPDARAQNLGLEDFVRLAWEIEKVKAARVEGEAEEK